MVKYCPRCGAPNDDDANFCIKCGYSFAQSAAKQAASPSSSASYYQYQQPQAQKKRKRDPKEVAEGLIASLVIIFALFAAMSMLGMLNQTYTLTIFNGSANVNPGSYSYVWFSVPSNAIDVRLTGYLTAAGGSGNDVKVYVMDYSDFVNYENGHSFSTYYWTGQQTSFNLNVGLPSGAGTYYVIFDNTFSIFSSKTVTGTLTLTYEVPP